MVGEPTVGLGNARGVGAPLTHETGPVTALNRTVNAEDSLTGSSEEVNGLIEVAADVRPGDSGGPLVNSAGQVIGVVTAASVNYQMGPGGEGFAIPINDAMAVAGQIRSGAPSATVHIGQPVLLGVGIGTQPRRAPGIIVRDVMHGGPAAQAGVAIGDVITVLDGTPAGLGHHADLRAGPALPRRCRGPDVDRPQRPAAHRQGDVGFRPVAHPMLSECTTPLLIGSSSGRRATLEKAP